MAEGVQTEQFEMEGSTENVEGGEQFVEDADSIDYTMEALTSSGYSKKTVEKVKPVNSSHSLSLPTTGFPSCHVLSLLLTLHSVAGWALRSGGDGQVHHRAILHQLLSFAQGPQRPVSALCLSQCDTAATRVRGSRVARPLARTGRRKALEQEMSQAGVSDAKKVKKRQKLERGFIRYGVHAVEHPNALK
jgi:hypothetical protein